MFESGVRFIIKLMQLGKTLSLYPFKVKYFPRSVIQKHFMCHRVAGHCAWQQPMQSEAWQGFKKMASFLAWTPGLCLLFFGPLSCMVSSAP